MGCKNSKPKSAHLRKLEEEKEREENDGCDGVSDADIIKRNDQETINVIKKDLNETPETFVLNNVLMCTIFLRNYQEDIRDFENKEELPTNFWEPDVVMEKANKNVVYRPMHGPNKDIAERLVKKRVYVPLNEIINVYSPLDDVEDSESNSSSQYQVKTEESKRKGFVKLQRLNAETNHDRNSMKDMLVASSSNNSAGSDSESTCTSTGTALSDNPQLIKDQNYQVSLDDCFVFRKVKKPDIDLDMEDLDHENLKEEDIYDVVSYLPSRKFMKYFQSKVFRDTIAEQLGLGKYEIDNSIVDEHIPGKIFCNIKDENGNCYPVEVLPCLKCSWPSKQTYEFMEQKNEASENKHGYFQWPTNGMLDVIKQLDCALVPKGYSRKRGVYPEAELEWEIHFPLAEGYLETLLRPEQIKCYLILLSIYKEYLEVHTKGHGLVPEHLLTLILWESEKDYAGWPEHRLGMRLLNIIENFSVMLSKRTLRDYFIRKKDIFKNVSPRYLLVANEVFHKIKQSPVMSILRALRNVRYTSGKFYPPLDYKGLLDILYKKDWDENPYISNLNLNYESNDNLSESSTSLDKKPKFTDAEKQVEYLKEKEIRRKLREKLKKKQKVKSDANLSYNFNRDARRESCDSINDSWECEKRFDRQKKIALLKFFINNYLEIAQASFKIGSKTQTMFYLKQAWYLTKILEEENQLFGEEVKDYFKKIKKQEDRVIGVMQENLTTYGSIDTLDAHYGNKDKELLEEELASLDDVTDRNFNGNKQSNGGLQINGDVDLHQQIRQTRINLKSLSRSFSTISYSHSQQKSVENLR